MLSLPHRIKLYPPHGLYNNLYYNVHYIFILWNRLLRNYCSSSPPNIFIFYVSKVKCNMNIFNTTTILCSYCTRPYCCKSGTIHIMFKITRKTLNKTNEIKCIYKELIIMKNMNKIDLILYYKSGDRLVWQVGLRYVDLSAFVRSAYGF